MRTHPIPRNSPTPHAAGVPLDTDGSREEGVQRKLRRSLTAFAQSRIDGYCELRRKIFVVERRALFTSCVRARSRPMVSKLTDSMFADFRRLPSERWSMTNLAKRTAI
jgi:hypothetical protein